MNALPTKGDATNIFNAVVNNAVVNNVAAESVSDAVVNAVNNVAESVSDAVAEVVIPKKKSYGWVVVVVVVILILGGGLAAYFLLKKKKRKVKQPGTTTTTTTPPTTKPPKDPPTTKPPKDPPTTKPPKDPPTTKAPKDPPTTKAAKKCKPGADAKCTFTTRVLDGDTWLCPPGYLDTGCDWVDGDVLGAKQCQQCSSGTNTKPATTKAAKKCKPGADAKCTFTTRVLNGDTWLCPPGYLDTGCDWVDGDVLGAKQCQQCTNTTKAATKKPVKCAPGNAKTCIHRPRELSGDTWVCPPGFDDTGCGWADGDNGPKQCQKCLSTGDVPKEWQRPWGCTPGDTGGCDFKRREFSEKAGTYVCGPGFVDTGCDWVDGSPNDEKQCRSIKCSGTGGGGGGGGGDTQVQPGGKVTNLGVPSMVKGSSPWNFETISDSNGTFEVKQDGLYVTYPKGCGGECGSNAGITARAVPKCCFPTDKLLMSYEINVPNDFEFVKGGKLPGVWIGEYGATGGDHMPDGGSVRLMWREGGEVVAYIYIPTQVAGGNQTETLKKQGFPSGVADPTGRTGIDVWGGSGLKLVKNQWNTVAVGVAMNDVGQSNGQLSLTVNGTTKSFTSMTWRSNASVKISGVLMTTFFGGNDSSWAPPRDVWLGFRNFQITS